MRFILEEAPAVTVGLVMPLRDKSQDSGQISNKRLTKLAHWVRHHILDDELARAQLPLNVPTRKKSASKPPHW